MLSPLRVEVAACGTTVQPVVLAGVDMETMMCAFIEPRDSALQNQVSVSPLAEADETFYIKLRVSQSWVVLKLAYRVVALLPSTTGSLCICKSQSGQTR